MAQCPPKASAASDALLDNGQGVIDPEIYFEMNTAPANLPDFEARLTTFVNHQQQHNRKLVLITSGGTTVPLENQTVRFIDNFSNGHRGACSAEYFLKQGYAVVFMHRQFSLQPFHRHYTHNASTGFLDYLEPESDGSVHVRPEYAKDMHARLTEYRHVVAEKRLLLLDFVTLSDYLFKLRSSAQILEKLERRAMYYLAAAVSDFFIPSQKMNEHKIQSGEGALNLSLDQVPKFLKPLVSAWAAKTMIVSFKLETDSSLLVPKARQALTRYGHQVVIGNMLSTRKQTVTLITRESDRDVSLSPEEMAHNVEIESKIIPHLVNIHHQWIEAQPAVDPITKE